ncbi:MAG: TIGR00159 family protein, partial [Elusimicrobia bacterium]|nr:TIGR00159 family protein [Elusimicrobiota bacterium]
MDLLLHLWHGYIIHILDICVTAFVVYRLILLFQGTRAMQVLVGLIIIS